MLPEGGLSIHLVLWFHGLCSWSGRNETWILVADPVLEKGASNPMFVRICAREPHIRCCAMVPKFLRNSSSVKISPHFNSRTQQTVESFYSPLYSSNAFTSCSKDDGLYLWKLSSSTKTKSNATSFCDLLMSSQHVYQRRQQFVIT